MEAHFVGSSSTPPKNGGSAQNEGTSLVVLQFMAIVLGEEPVHVPGNAFRTVGVTAEERYCLGCYGVRWHDVWFGLRMVEARVVGFNGARCRYCGKEVE